MRVGIGYDVHRLALGPKLILGGVEIPYEKGLVGHSDADVLVHAIIDALLGAAALGDIGKFFPDTDSKYAGADSIKLLSVTAASLRSAGFYVVNVDSVLVAQRPKVAPYVEQMRSNIAAALAVSFDQVGVKATTTEGLGFAGSGEGMEAQAVCLIEAKE